MFKKLLKKFLPASAQTTNNYNHEFALALASLQSDISEIKDSLDNLKQTSAYICNTLGYKKDFPYDINDMVNEMFYANVWNSTISGCEWLGNKSFSPSGMAASYSLLYIIFRVLRDTRPKRILEIGLGESTRLISQYASFHNDVKHFVVEHDPQWISFFAESFDISESTEVVQLPLTYQQYKSVESVRVYDRFAEHFSSGTYDLIVIDAPYGYDMPEYSRIDALSLLPDCLSKSFSILIHDYHRQQEQNTANQLLSILKEAGVPYVKSVYTGTKHTFIVCSEDYRFLMDV